MIGKRWLFVSKGKPTHLVWLLEYTIYREVDRVVVDVQVGSRVVGLVKDG